MQFQYWRASFSFNAVGAMENRMCFSWTASNGTTNYFTLNFISERICRNILCRFGSVMASGIDRELHGVP